MVRNIYYNFGFHLIGQNLIFILKKFIFTNKIIVLNLNVLVLRFGNQMWNVLGVLQDIINI